MNYYPFHVGDYTTHTAHLDPIEDLAYRRMLDMYYLREEPLPASVPDVARLIRLRDHEQQVESVLSEFFHLSPDGWRQGRCDAEIGKMQDLQQKQREKANKRWRGSGTADAVQKESSSNATAMPRQFHSNSEAMPPTPTPTPDVKEQELLPSAGAEAPTVADPIWHTGLAFLRRKGLPESTARKFLGKLKREAGDIGAAALLAQADAEDITDPIPWLSAAAVQSRNQRSRGGNHATGTQGRNLSAVERVEQAIRDRRDAEARNAVSGCN